MQDMTTTTLNIIVSHNESSMANTEVDNDNSKCDLISSNSDRRGNGSYNNVYSVSSGYINVEKVFPNILYQVANYMLAGQLAHAYFLEIYFVCKVYMCVCLSLGC